jgi:hypothetical protein
MSRLEEKLTDQFFDWELYGRGWYIWDTPVAPEPPFRPFYGHYVPREEILDDGRRPTFLSSLVEKLSKGLADKAATEQIPEEEETPEPKIFERESIVELQTSLPLTSNISKENIEQLLFSLGHCREPLSFEIIGSHDSIIAQFAASEPDANRLQQQLEANFSDGVFIPQSCVLERKWTENQNDETLIVQFGLSREFMFPIATGKGFGVDPYIGITGALSKLQEGETGVFQVIFERVKNPWGESILRSVTDNAGGDFFVNAPELVKETKNKISRPLYAAVVRIAVKTDYYDRTVEIARGLCGALSVFSNPHGNEFIPLENKEYPHTAHEEDLLRRQSRRCGMILNSDELISLVHIPSSSVRTPKLQRETQKSKAAPKIVLSSSGILLGENEHVGKVNEIRLNAEQRVRHTYCIGGTGTGKSTFLFSLIQQDIENGEGVAVLDPHGDLVDKILGVIPPERIEDVVLVNPSDEEYSIGFNILSAHSDLEKTLLSSDLVSVFQRLSTSWGDQMGSVLNNAILAFLESSKGGTLADLRRFLIEPAFRNQFLETVNDPDIVYYWRKAFPTLAGNKSIGSVLTRLDTFLSPKPIRYMVSQKENRLDFADIMNSGKIFLAKLSQGKMGKENSYLMGSLLVAKFHQAAMGRANLPENERRNFWCYIDEFHNFITPSMAEILSGARKYRIGLILAHQELRQLQRDSDVASAVLSQPYTRVCFRVGDDDARKLDDGFSFFEAKDLQSLPNFEAICRVERADFDFNIAIPFPNQLDNAEIRKQVITSSRRKYAVSRQQIEAELRDKAEIPAKFNIPPVPISKPSPPPIAPIVQAEKAVVIKEPIAPVILKPKAVSVEPATMGRGGREHQFLQHLIKNLAIDFGFQVEVEKETPDGCSVDVALKKGAKTLAFEISVSTPVEYEIGNIRKCLKAGFDTIAILCPERAKLIKIQQAVKKELSSDEIGRLRFCVPDEVSSLLLDFAAQSTSKETVSYGRKTKVVYQPLSEAEAKRRLETLAQITTKSLRQNEEK